MTMPTFQAATPSTFSQLLAGNTPSIKSTESAFGTICIVRRAFQWQAYYEVSILQISMFFDPSISLNAINFPSGEIAIA